MSPSPPVVEIQGTWLQNVGARQMLHAAVTQSRAAGLDVAIDPCWGRHGFRRDLGLLAIAPRAMPGAWAVTTAMRAARHVAPGVVGRLYDDYGLVERSEIAGLADASGFALSDQWGPRKASQRLAVARTYLRTGRPVVLLPQAMGPFTDAGTARAARELILAADLVWVRDERSMAYATDLAGPAARIARSPDMTLLEPGPAPTERAAAVVIVPNGRLIEQGGLTLDAYVRAMVAGGVAARERDRDIEVLLHTTEPEDERLGGIIASELGCALRREDDALAMKGRLGTAELVVGSRFHALLGALSHGVPTVAIGWSHKYNELFADFGISDLALAGAEPGPMADAVGQALDAGPALHDELLARADGMRRRVLDMWDQSLDVLGGSRSAVGLR